MKEIWKNIRGYRGKYKISNLGRVKSFHKCKEGNLLKNVLNKDIRYEIVGLCLNGKLKTFYVHRLIAKAFIPNPKGLTEINHKNGIKTDNRIKNLEWTTKNDNIKHAINLGLIDTKGEKNGRAKLNRSNINDIRRKYASGNYSYATLARVYKVSRNTITRIVKRKLWNHV